LNYNDYSTAQAWTKVGPSLSVTYAGQNSCAARVSYGLAYGGQPIPSKPEFQTNLNSDGKRYIISAEKLRGYLNWRWCEPDYTWSSSGIHTIESLRALLMDGKIAVIAWNDHTAVVTPTYKDQYTPRDGDGDIWILSP